jgi:hypothetical protein
MKRFHAIAAMSLNRVIGAGEGLAFVRRSVHVSTE